LKYTEALLLLLPASWSLVQCLFLAIYRANYTLDMGTAQLLIYPVGVSLALWLQSAAGVWITPDRVVAIQDAVLALALSTVGAVLLRSSAILQRASPALAIASLLGPWWSLPYLSNVRFDEVFGTLLLAYTACVLIGRLAPASGSFRAAVLTVGLMCVAACHLAAFGWPPGYLWEHSGACATSLALLVLMVAGFLGPRAAEQ
jgi:hypothetical protein